jgi:hypothetical protein
MLTAEKKGARLQVTFMGAALQPEKLQERMRRGGFARVVGFRPTGAAPPPASRLCYPSSQCSATSVLHCRRHAGGCTMALIECVISDTTKCRQGLLHGMTDWPCTAGRRLDVQAQRQAGGAAGGARDSVRHTLLRALGIQRAAGLRAAAAPPPHHPHRQRHRGPRHVRPFWQSPCLLGMRRPAAWG